MQAWLSAWWANSVSHPEGGASHLFALGHNKVGYGSIWMGSIRPVDHLACHGSSCSMVRFGLLVLPRLLHSATCVVACSPSHHQRRKGRAKGTPALTPHPLPFFFLFLWAPAAIHLKTQGLRQKTLWFFFEGISHAGNQASRRCAATPSNCRTGHHTDGERR